LHECDHKLWQKLLGVFPKHQKSRQGRPCSCSISCGDVQAYQRFFLWSREPRAVTQAAMDEARTIALPRYATIQELFDALEQEE